MIFIDESFKEIYVMGAVVGLQHEVEDTIHAARAYIKKNNRNCPKKIILKEIKDSEIHREHPQIKQMVLENLIKIKSMKGKIRENISIYSVFLESKDICRISQTTAYKILSIELIRRIVSSYGENQNCFNFEVYRNPPRGLPPLQAGGEWAAGLKARYFCCNMADIVVKYNQ